MIKLAGRQQELLPYLYFWVVVPEYLISQYVTVDVVFLILHIVFNLYNVEQYNRYA